MPAVIDQFTTLFRPPVSICSEFEVERSVIPAGSESYQIVPVDCGSILLFLEGSCNLNLDGNNLEAQSGSSIFIAAGAKVQLSIKGGDQVLFYRAHANLG